MGLSEISLRYQAKYSAENAEIADLLILLTHNQRNWAFGLCVLFQRNWKGHVWNCKRVYRIYRELELNFRIKPEQPIGRKERVPLAVPEAIDGCWSMEFMHDQLSDGQGLRILNCDRERPNMGRGDITPKMKVAATKLVFTSSGG